MAVKSLPIRIAGIGAVSPAGWGVEPMLAAVRAGLPLPIEESVRAPGAPQCRARRVPKPGSPLPLAREPRMRRTSPVAQFAVAAALEAVGPERVAAVHDGALHLGVISVIMNGCVNFSRRFYSEVLDNPATASPLVFPETVFNAPSSHLSALLRSREVNYTLVGDSAQFIAAFDLAAMWMEAGDVDGCVIVGADEFDWLSAEAASLLDRSLVVAEGAAAVYVEPAPEAKVRVSPPRLISSRHSRHAVAGNARTDWRGQIPPGASLFDGLSGSRRTDAAERGAWGDWTGPRVSVKSILGEGMGAGAGWQCVAAAAALADGTAPHVLVTAVGSNQQALGALFSA